jgi:hypothetical protein
VLSAAIEIVEEMLSESYVKGFLEISLAVNTLGREREIFQKTFVINYLMNIKTLGFAPKVDEATDVLKDAHLIAYVRYMPENGTK